MTRARFACAWLAASLLIAALGLPRGLPAQQSCPGKHTQTALNACADQDARRASALLDTLLHELYRSLDAGRAAELRQVQAQWTRYRDTECRWESGTVRGGSAESMVYATCSAALTDQRIVELRDYLCDNDSGTCPALHRYRVPEDRRRRTS